MPSWIYYIILKIWRTGERQRTLEIFWKYGGQRTLPPNGLILQKWLHTSVKDLSAFICKKNTTTFIPFSSALSVWTLSPYSDATTEEQRDWKVENQVKTKWMQSIRGYLKRWAKLLKEERGGGGDRGGGGMSPGSGWCWARRWRRQGFHRRGMCSGLREEIT